MIYLVGVLTLVFLRVTGRNTSWKMIVIIQLRSVIIYHKRDVAKKDWSSRVLFYLKVEPSRKRFLCGKCNCVSRIGRHTTTVSATTYAILGGANIIRTDDARFGVDTANIC